MRPIARRARMTVLGALAALAVFIPSVASAASHPPAASRASAVRLRGDWAPFTRCPVDAKAMLGADGANHIAVCVASSSPSGSLRIGGSTLAAGASNLQFGLVGSYAAGFSIVSPSGGAISAAPVNVPGGLLGIVCPTSNPLLALLCNMLVNSPLNAVTATIQQAGAPSNFNFTAGITAGKPIVRIPVKIHLSNPLLGPNCYIGTNANPIVLRPKNKTTPNVRGDSFNANGTPNPGGVMSGIFSTGGTQQDTSFAVPGASGCTLLGLGLPINFLVNQKEGLPSPAGHNSLVLNKASAYLAGLTDPVSAAPNDGKDLSKYWHSAVLK